MDRSKYGYEYWEQHHSDCELVHVIWTDYCGILHEKLVPADIFHRMYREDKKKSFDSSDLVPLTVGAAALITLPNGERPDKDQETCLLYGTQNLIPDYDTIQACIDSRSRATVFAELEENDPRVVLRWILQRDASNNKPQISAAVEFQFVLRSLTDGATHLPKSNGAGQNILQELAGLLRNHSHKATGLAMHSSEISDDGVITILPVMSDDLLTAVDNYYRIKRALVSMAALRGYRPSFFCALEDVPGATYSGTPHDVMCENKLSCRLHLICPPSEATKFAAGLITTGGQRPSVTAVYAFTKPNFLTYALRNEYEGPDLPEPRWMTWGIRNNETTINFPDGLDDQRLEFSDIDGMANMYLAAAAIAFLGQIGINRSFDLDHNLQGAYICSSDK